MILVIAEHRDGKLNRATLETIAAAQSAGGGPIKVAVLGSGVDAVANELKSADVATQRVDISPAPSQPPRNAKGSQR